MDSVDSPGDSSSDRFALVLKRWKPVGRSGLLPALIEAQEVNGWLSEETLLAIGQGLNVPLSEVYGVADFYAHLYTHPVGRQIVRVCDDVPCFLSGSEKICATVEDVLHIREGETTTDGAFTYEIVPCLGHCDRGPVLMIGNQVEENVTPGRITELLGGHGN
ncbi:MAG: NADH-quinone oxidoreductase subunit NuoE [Acidobacteriota bacterium]